jgi:hypothetical protein
LRPGRARRHCHQSDDAQNHYKKPSYPHS